MNMLSKTRLQLALLSLFYLCTTCLQAQDYQKAWEALNQGNLTQAQALLEKASQQTSTAIDAAFTQILIAEYNGQEPASRKHLTPIQKMDFDLSPYYYAKWWNEGVAGTPGMKTKEQKNFLEQELKNPKLHPQLKAAIQYHLGHHYIRENKFNETRNYWSGLANLLNWQVTGAFDNISESGFDKNYPPIEQAEPTAKFKASNNSEIYWFTPSADDGDPWLMTGDYIQWETGIVYAQTFVNSPSDQDVLLGLGFTGSAKVWLNDRLLFAEQEPRTTDFDFFRVPCSLKKGVNRVLVQLGYVNEGGPNFIVRFLDQKDNLLPGLISSATYAPYPKDSQKELPKVLPFFAEEFFRNKIAAEPNNLLNYLMLANCYRRANKNQEAIDLVERALKLAPDNPLLLFEQIQCFIKLNNRTAMLTAFEALKEREPDSYLSLNISYEQSMGNEQFEDAEKALLKIVDTYGEDPNTFLKRITLAGRQEKIEELLKQVDRAALAYPEEREFAMMQYRVAMQIQKSSSAGRVVLEQFLKRNYSLDVLGDLARHQIEYGSVAIGVSHLEKLRDLFPNSTSMIEPLYDHYLAKKEYKKAKVYIDQILSLAPFNGRYWKLAAQLAELSGNESEALQLFQKALHYSPNDHELRKRIRLLEKKPELSSFFPTTDVYALIKKTNAKDKEGKYDWYYILDEQNTIIYPERNSERIHNIAVKVLNEKGIDYWKESSIGYNPNHQRLVIEKAEVIKANGSKVPAEQNDNELVFPNLTIGDALYLNYRIVGYSYGRMAREFWDNFSFNSRVPVELNRCSFLVPESIPFHVKNQNFEDKALTKKLDEGFTLYSWERSNEPAIADERLSPPHLDIAKSIFVSTISDWNEISNWYSDVSTIQAKPDYEVQKLVAELFPEKTALSEMTKAQRIYDWILNNIRYSSVPFRQSAYVPQRAAKVIQTSLGDCKDVATLYAALARSVGLKANLVLVSTRSSGRSEMLLPSMEFNHCIVKVMIEGKAWYLELTDSNLPFGALPNEDYQALALEIPYNETLKNNAIFVLKPNNRVQDQRKNEAIVNLNKRDFEIKVKYTTSGAVSANVRSIYKDLSEEKRKEEMQSNIAEKFSNAVTLKELSFGDLTTRQDTFHYQVAYTVKNEVVQIGALSTFKVPFYNLFVKADAFTEEERRTVLSYWDYEDIDHYLDVTIVNLPEGKTFTEVPENLQLAFKNMTYSLKYEKVGTSQLKVVRDIQVQRDDIAVEEYKLWRAFVDAVLDAESKYVAFK